MYPIDEIDDLVLDEDVIEDVEEEVEEEALLIGYVADCARLNVRSHPYPSAAIKCVIEKDSEVMINDAESTDTFYKVITASGIEGYCMKKFISVQP